MPDGVLDPAGLLGTLSAHGVDFVVIGRFSGVLYLHTDIERVDERVPAPDEPPFSGRGSRGGRA